MGEPVRSTLESPASYWNELAVDQQSGKAKRCRCGEFNPATYDCCYHCQQPLPDVEQTEVLAERLAGLVRDFLDPAPCVLDHHGYCQAHGWLSSGRCPHARAREVLADYDTAPQPKVTDARYCTSDRCVDCGPGDECCETTCGVCPRVSAANGCTMTAGEVDGTRSCHQHEMYNILIGA